MMFSEIIESCVLVIKLIWTGLWNYLYFTYKKIKSFSTKECEELFGARLNAKLNSAKSKEKYNFWILSFIVLSFTT